MVPLETRLNYLSTINDSPKLTAFRNLLFDDNIVLPQNIGQSEADEIYFGLIKAIKTTDKQSFEAFFNRKNKSNPSKESPSPFVNDDFLIFSLIVGIEKFHLDKKWIKNIVTIRSRNQTTITFENILNENYYSKSNLPEIIIVYFQLSNLSLITNDYLNTAYKTILENIGLFEGKNNFLILCSLRAYDTIIEFKEVPDGSEVHNLKTFNKKFIQRTKILGTIIQTIFVITLLYATMKIISINSFIKEWINQLNTAIKLFGFIGLGLIGNKIPILKRKIHEIIMTILGYPKALIIKTNKNENK